MTALTTPTAPRRLMALGLLLAAVAVVTPPAARPQSPGSPNAYYRRETTWNIRLDPRSGGWAKQVELFVSRDQGRDWQRVSSANPTDSFFPPFTPTEDGAYWFAVRGVDSQGQPYPRSLAELVAEYQIVLDRKPPVISLRQVPDTRANVVTLEWDVRDENLDLNRFSMEYRVQRPGNDWQRETRARPAVTGLMSWGVEPGMRMEVRLRVADKAGNVGEAVLPVGLTADSQPTAARPATSFGGNPTGGPRQVYYLNSYQISLDYTAKVTLSGISAFDLWYTTDRGQKWSKAPQSADSKTPGSLPANPGAPITDSGTLLFTATAPGLYGFRIVARNGVGIGSPDPLPGDPPDHWVMVDVEKPTIQLTVQRGQGQDVRNVRVHWEARDENLADRPVTLQYAEVKDAATTPTDADWKPIEGHDGPQTATGDFVWTIGNKGPFRFLVRANAVDKAGNANADQTPKPVVVDMEHPTVIIGGIRAGGGKAPDR